MKVVVAPDSFKGSIEAQEFCDLAEQTLGKLDPSINVIKKPLADGGEGTLEVLKRLPGVEVYECRVSGPNILYEEESSRIITAEYLHFPEKNIVFFFSSLPTISNKLRNTKYAKFI